MQSFSFPPAASAWRHDLAELGPAFFTDLPAQGLPQPSWVLTSQNLAESMGWPSDWWQQTGDAEQAPALEVLAGNATWPGMRSGATVYSGHQFGVWAGQLGDGRAHLLGGVETAAGRLELQLKGAGPTPYSRRADGRAVLRSSIREFLGSEAMHHLGVPTTRALALVASPLPVRRERMETAAVVTRVAPSFLRFGHFEHFCHHGQHTELRRLLDHALEQHFPKCREAPEPAIALLEEVTRRTARLIAHWQALGFCHGVMNTDNMSVLGLTLDYGPFGFLDTFDPGHICNHSDDSGRYAFDRQPQIGWWNLHALAQALLPCVGSGQGEPAELERIKAALALYPGEFAQAMAGHARAKLGFLEPMGNDQALFDDWLALLARNRADYTIAFRRLCDFKSGDDAGHSDLASLFADQEAWQTWAQRYRQRLAAESSADAERGDRMRRANPRYILRNHLAERAIQQAQAGDFGEVQRLMKVLSRPYDEQAEFADEYAGFPPDWARHLSVSCSS